MKIGVINLSVIFSFFRDFLDGVIYLIWVIICLVFILLCLWSIRKKKGHLNPKKPPVETSIPPPTEPIPTVIPVSEGEVKSPYSGDRL